MKRLALIIGAVLLATPAMAGYRDLKRELEAYTPPAMLRAPERPATPQRPAEDGADNSLATLRQMHDHWEAVVDNSSGAVWHGSVPPAVRAAAGDDREVMDLLQAELSLPVVDALIAVRNPAVKASRNRFLAALEGFDQVAAAEEILHQYSAFTEGVMPGVGPMVGMDGIAARFPFPGVTALKGQVADRNVAIQKAAMDLTLRDRLAQGRKAYWNLAYVHRALTITREMRDRFDHLESVATTRYTAGRTSYQDVIRIRIGREKLSEQLITLAAQRINLETELLALVDLRPGQTIGTPVHEPPITSLPEVEPLYPLALGHRQELVRLRAMVDKMERMLEMGETMLRPPFSSGQALFTDEAILQAGSVGTKPAFGTTVSPVRGKGTPANAWFGARDAYLRETRRTLAARKADLADAETQTHPLVRTGWYDLDFALREWRLYRQRLLELAQTSLEVTTRGYESGSVSFADVTGAYTGWLEIHLTTERRISDVGIARAELERRIGAPLP